MLKTSQLRKRWKQRRAEGWSQHRLQSRISVEQSRFDYANYWARPYNYNETFVWQHLAEEQEYIICSEEERANDVWDANATL